jgi:hypothetical protein
MLKSHVKPGRGSLRKILLAGLAAGTTALALSACGGTAAHAGTSDGSAQNASATADVAMTLQVDADEGPAGWFTGKEDWPRYAPGDGTNISDSYNGAINLPANTTVTLTISSHDDGVTALPDNSPYNKVAGGTMTVDGKPVTNVSNKDIAHTITVPDLGINIPIPASPEGGTVTVKFTFTTGAAGTYQWRCMTPCGGGKDGMAGAMAKDGWMRGNFVVA